MRIPFAEIEFNPVQLGESDKRQRSEMGDVDAVALCKQWQHVVAAIIPSANRRTRVAHRHHAKLRERRSRRETFIRINLVARRMIDRQQPHSVEIDRFLHRLQETETEYTVARLRTLPGNLQVLGRIRHITFAGSNPVADYAGADHVRDELILFSIPRKENGT